MKYINRQLKKIKKKDKRVYCSILDELRVPYGIDSIRKASKYVSRLNIGYVLTVIKQVAEDNGIAV